MFGSFLPNLWSSCNQSVRSKEPTLLCNQVDTGGGGKYGYGFGDRSFGGIHCFGHGGGAPGMNGDLEICPKAGYVVTVLSNIDPPAASRVSEFALNRLPEE
jgi:hypothetical protein